MKWIGLSWKAILGSGLLILASLFVAFWLLAGEIERFRNDAVQRELLTAANTVLRALAADSDHLNTKLISDLIEPLREQHVDAIVATPDGTIIGATLPIPSGTISLVDYPELRDAIERGHAAVIRPNVQRLAESHVVAFYGPADAADPLLVWLARPVWRLQDDRQIKHRLIATLAVVGIAALIAVSFAMTYRRARILRRITRAARRLSRGDLSVRADVPGSDDWAKLARALNETRQRLLADAETIDRQRRTLQALVDQIGEGAIAVRDDGRVVLINPAAIRLLNLDVDPGESTEMVGQVFEQCVPQHELQKLLHAAREEALRAETALEPLPTDPTMPVAETKIKLESRHGRKQVLARVAQLALPDPARTGQEATGWLLVLTDITDLTRALEIQTDFVANASHELRTPLSAIRASIETLLQMDLVEDAGAATGFLNMLDRQCTRLNEMVTDLLDLSRLDAGIDVFEPQTLDVHKVVRTLEERTSPALKSKQIRWRFLDELGPSSAIRVNAHLLQLVLDNLVDNAIKFTDQGGQVSLCAARDDNSVLFEVADTGCGIPEEDQQRVFERFYQVERARSGMARGTGLGLAIVRQAAIAMGGEVSLTSHFGEGTRVTLRVPQPRRAASLDAREASPRDN